MNLMKRRYKKEGKAMQLLKGRTLVRIGIIMLLSLWTYTGQSATAPAGILGSVIVSNTPANPT
jgi:hypothetical protein